MFTRRTRAKSDEGRSRGDRGAVLIEAAIAMPVFMSLLLGMFTGGFALHHKIDLALAAREGARYGSTVSPDQCASTCNGQTWAQLVQSLAVQRSNGDLQTADVCVALVSGSGSNPAALDASHTTAPGGGACFVDNSSDTGERVQVRVTRNDRVEWLFASLNVSLQSSAVSRFER